MSRAAVSIVCINIIALAHCAGSDGSDDHIETVQHGLHSEDHVGAIAAQDAEDDLNTDGLGNDGPRLALAATDDQDSKGEVPNGRDGGDQIATFGIPEALYYAESRGDQLLEEGRYSEVLDHADAVSRMSTKDIPLSFLFGQRSGLLLTYNFACNQLAEQATDLLTSDQYYERSVRASEDWFLIPFGSIAVDEHDVPTYRSIKFTLSKRFTEARNHAQTLAGSYFSAAVDQLEQGKLSAAYTALEKMVVYRDKSIQYAEKALELNDQVTSHVAHDCSEASSQIKAAAVDNINYARTNLYMSSKFFAYASSLEAFRERSSDPAVLQKIGTIIERPSQRKRCVERAKAVFAKLEVEGKPEDLECLRQLWAENPYRRATKALIDSRRSRAGTKYKAAVTKRIVNALEASSSEHIDRARRFNTIGTPDSFSSDIQYLSSLLTSSRISQRDDDSLEFVELLEKRIQEHILGQERSFSNLSTQDRLERVYDIYVKLVDISVVRLEILNAIRCSILAGRPDAAIERAGVLKHLDVKSTGTISVATRYLSAIAKNLVGDHEEWLSLVTDATARKKKEQDDRKRANEKKRGKRRQLIATQQALDRKQHELALAEAERAKAQAQQRLLDRADQQASIACLPQNIAPSGTQSSESKEQRLKRHADNEERRRLARAAADEQTHPSDHKDPSERKSPPLAPATARDTESTTISDVFDVSGSLPKRINDQIENDTWRFRRPDLEEYFRHLGCVVSTGKGVHTKIELPEWTTISFNNQVISVFNEFGGALPLPKWSDAFVPYYLRQQIRLARSRLVAFKQAELATRAQGIDNLGTNSQ